MTQRVSHGAATREPVYSGTRRVRGLWKRRLADGSTVFEGRLRLDGLDRTVRLEASTKTDAIRELEALRVDRERGERRHRSLAPSLDELASEWFEHLESRIGIRDERRRYARRTVDLYRHRLHKHVLDVLGSRHADELTPDDVRRLVDRLTRRGLAPSTVTSTINILSGLLQFGLRHKVIAHNVVRDLDRSDRPGARRLTEPRYLNRAEVARLLERMSDVFRPVAAVCAYAGLRVSEALVCAGAMSTLSRTVSLFLGSSTLLGTGVRRRRLEPRQRQSRSSQRCIANS